MWFPSNLEPFDFSSIILYNNSLYFLRTETALRPSLYAMKGSAPARDEKLHNYLEGA